MNGRHVAFRTIAAHVRVSTFDAAKVWTGWGGCLPGWHSPTESQSVHLRESVRFMGEERDNCNRKNDKIATEMYVGVFRNVKSLKTIPILPTSWITQRNKWGGNYFFCGDDSESGVRNGTLVNIQRMDSPHRCGQIMTGRLLLYNIFTGNPPNSLSLSSSY